MCLRDDLVAAQRDSVNTPFAEVIEWYKVFCHRSFVYSFQGSMPPFITRELLEKTPKRRLTSVGDVSCDPNSLNNPIPIYDSITSW
jgi:saccharopine dehydrogenase (NAD+, L-lysine-forming)